MMKLISRMIGLTVSEILKFQILYLEKVDQGYKRISFAMVSFDGKYQNRSVVWYFFALALTVSEIATLKNFELQKVSQGHGVNFLQ